MNMFKPTEAKTPEEYINLIEDLKRKEEVIALDKLIRKTVPDLEPFIISGMIGYGKYSYKYASGKEGDWATILLASQKNYISVYICAANGKEYLPESYKDKFPKADIGRSCIRIKKIDDIDLEILKEIIKKGAEMVSQGKYVGS